MTHIKKIKHKHGKFGEHEHLFIDLDMKCAKCGQVINVGFSLPSYAKDLTDMKITTKKQMESKEKIK